MKQSKKWLSLLLAVLMIITCLSACGDTKDRDDKDRDSSQSDKDNDAQGGSDIDGYLLTTKDSVAPRAPATTLDPQSVYQRLVYSPQMFYGLYQLAGGKDAEDRFAKNATYTEINYKGDTVKISSLPYYLCAGPHSMAHSINYVKEHNWARLYYMRLLDDGSTVMSSYLAAYTVEGTTLSLRLLDTIQVDSDNDKITYALSDVVLTYAFSFRGRQLTLSAGNDTVTLSTGLESYGQYDNFYLSSYLSEGSASADGLDHVNLRYNQQDKSSYFYAESTKKEDCYNGNAVIEDNGRITFTLPWENHTQVCQYVYFLCGTDGIVLADEKGVYYYNDSYSDRNFADLRDFITDDQTGALGDLSDNQLEQLVEKKEDLLADLSAAFTQAGIRVTINADNGEMALDASILFGGDSATLTEEGKAFLNQFMEVYTSIAFSDKYAGFISKTMVEGHTAPVGNSTYEDGLPLSEERAQVVKEYCLTLNSSATLQDALEAVGYSNSKPIKGEDGQVDMAASRRVSFRFLISLE